MISTLLACVALGQIVASGVMGTSCLPCAVLCFLASWVAASAGTWSQAVSGAYQQQKHLLLSWACAIAAPCLLFLAITPSVGGDDRVALGTLGVPKQHRIHHIREIGLKPSGSRLVLYVGKEGCHPCTDGLRAIDAVRMTGLTFAYVGDKAPDATRPWVHLSHEDAITITPSVLYVDSKGYVKSQAPGFSTGSDGLIVFERQTLGFLRDGSLPVTLGDRHTTHTFTTADRSSDRQQENP